MRRRTLDVSLNDRVVEPQYHQARHAPHSEVGHDVYVAASRYRDQLMLMCVDHIPRPSN